MIQITKRDRLKFLAGGASLLLFGCGSGGGSAPVAPPPPTGGGGSGPQPIGFRPNLLSDTYQGQFRVGAALANSRISPPDASANLLLDQFNLMTPEWELKPDILSPAEGVYNFADADRIVDWAIANNLEVRGHTLLWHESVPAYMLQGTRDQIRTKLENYITTVMQHFAGRITSWDVVNEVVSVDIYNGASGVGPDRDTVWYQAVGNADYLDWALTAARAADPNAKLFLSDYETENPIKRDWLLEILRRFESRGVPIDGVGHQCHLQINTDPQEVLNTIDAIESEFPSLTNHVTELDVNMYDDPGTCWQSQSGCQADIGPNPPDSLLADQAQLLRTLFDGLTGRPSVEMVNFWGVKDDDSWLNDMPIQRYNYPLLFDRNGDPKPAYYAITDPNYVI